jgi:uridine kinase
MHTCHVIAIAAPVGGGKSTLSLALARALDNAPTLHFDDYQGATARPHTELEAWLDGGGDVAAFVEPRLLRDLGALKGGQAITHPVTGAVLQPARYIVLEMPLGRADPASSALIDLLFWIDVPLDVALARNLRGMTSSVLAGGPAQDARKFVAWLDQYLDNYLQVLRRVFARQQEIVAPKADVVLDGGLGVEMLVQRALSEINQRF